MTTTEHETRIINGRTFVVHHLPTAIQTLPPSVVGLHLAQQPEQCSAETLTRYAAREAGAGFDRTQYLPVQF